jgi:hypothetical protein
VSDRLIRFSGRLRQEIVGLVEDLPEGEMGGCGGYSDRIGCY